MNCGECSHKKDLETIQEIVDVEEDSMFQWASTRQLQRLAVYWWKMERIREILQGDYDEKY